MGFFKIISFNKYLWSSLLSQAFIILGAGEWDAVVYMTGNHCPHGVHILLEETENKNRNVLALQLNNKVVIGVTKEKKQGKVRE